MALVRSEFCSEQNYRIDSTFSLGQHAEVGSLEHLYTFLDYGKVQKFIFEHTFLIPILSQAYSKIIDYFGMDYPITLEVIREDEDPNDAYLLVKIHATASAEVITEVLSAFDDEWWLDTLHQARHLMVIDAECYNV